MTHRPDGLADLEFREMSGISRLTLIVILFSLLAPSASAQTTMPSSDVILEWNQVMLDANAALPPSDR